MNQDRTVSTPQSPSPSPSPYLAGGRLHVHLEMLMRPGTRGRKLIGGCADLTECPSLLTDGLGAMSVVRNPWQRSFALLSSFILCQRDYDREHAPLTYMNRVSRLVRNRIPRIVAYMLRLCQGPPSGSRQSPGLLYGMCEEAYSLIWLSATRQGRGRPLGAISIKGPSQQQPQ